MSLKGLRQSAESGRTEKLIQNNPNPDGSLCAIGLLGYLINYRKAYGLIHYFTKELALQM